jgi:hypothetical protein
MQLILLTGDQPKFRLGLPVRDAGVEAACHFQPGGLARFCQVVTLFQIAGKRIREPGSSPVVES